MIRIRPQCSSSISMSGIKIRVAKIFAKIFAKIKISTKLQIYILRMKRIQKLGKETKINGKVAKILINIERIANIMNSKI